MKFLLIEDKEQLVKDLILCLQVRYPQSTIVTARDGEDGVEMLETESPDCVVLDSTLPGPDTLELISRIREFSDVPLIIFPRMSLTLIGPGGWRPEPMNISPNH